jgi:predicted nucleic acid-binding protein
MSGTKIILDTNTLLFYLQGKLAVKNDISEIGISIITKIEYLVNPSLGLKDIHLFNSLEEYINVYYLSAKEDAIFKETIKIRKKYKLKLPDSIIAATAIVNNATLFSSDDIFTKIFNLKFRLIKV